MTATVCAALNNYSNSKNKKLLLALIVIVFLVVVFTSIVLVYKSMIDNDDVFLVGAVFVGSEKELREAVAKSGLGGESTLIALTKNVVLKEPLVVGVGKNVTLTSKGRFGGGDCFRLIGALGQSSWDEQHGVVKGGVQFGVIVVEGGGWLCLDGVVVTHNKGVAGRGVTVEAKGWLVLSDGEVSGNTLRTCIQ